MSESNELRELLLKINEQKHRYEIDKLKRNDVHLNTLIFFGILNLIFFVVGVVYFTVIK